MSLAHQVRPSPRTNFVQFDPNSVILTGTYADELSAYRARKVWIDTFLTMFLLERDSDFKLSIIRKEPEDGFILECQFLTACARYAFWRLTNEQAPEAQYLIETAHIPLCDSKQREFVSAPDLSPSTGVSGDALGNSPLSRWLTRVLK